MKYGVCALSRYRNIHCVCMRGKKIDFLSKNLIWYTQFFVCASEKRGENEQSQTKEVNRGVVL